MATEGCQFGQERIYLNVTRVSSAELPGGDVERVCLWLLCPLTHMPHAPQTIADSSIPVSDCSNSQGRLQGMKSNPPYVRIFSRKHTYIHTVHAHIKHSQLCITDWTRLMI